MGLFPITSTPGLPHFVALPGAPRPSKKPGSTLRISLISMASLRSLSLGAGPLVVSLAWWRRRGFVCPSVEDKRRAGFSVIAPRVGRASGSCGFATGPSSGELASPTAERLSARGNNLGRGAVCWRGQRPRHRATGGLPHGRWCSR